MQYFCLLAWSDVMFISMLVLPALGPSSFHSQVQCANLHPREQLASQWTSLYLSTQPPILYNLEIPS